MGYAPVSDMIGIVKRPSRCSSPRARVMFLPVVDLSPAGMIRIVIVLVEPPETLRKDHRTVEVMKGSVKAIDHQGCVI